MKLEKWLFGITRKTHTFTQGKKETKNQSTEGDRTGIKD